MNEIEVETLARYNGERSRGLVHTEEWRQRMTELQQRFDAEPRERPVMPWWRRWWRP